MHASSGRLLLFALIAVLFICGGLALRGSSHFSNYREYARPDIVPEALVRSGRTGKELRLLTDHADLGSLNIKGFDRQLRPEDMPSTTLLADEARTSGLPIISVVASPDDLFNRRSGLIANPHSRGKGWERPVYASYFAGGHLLFATGAGLRIHGGKSRKMPQTSFRLHFSELYGVPGVSRRQVFGGTDAPLRTLVLHNDFRVRGSWDTGTAWHYQDAVAHFANPISYDVSRRIGSLAPATQAARFYLNGVYQGTYVLTERVASNDFLGAHFGHDDFFMADTRAEDLKSNVIQGADAEWKRLQGWADRQRSPLHMQSVAQAIDIENLTNWFVGVLYLGTTDAFQGVVARDRRQADGRWFWINWDMDHSFRDWYARAERPWEMDTLRALGAEDDPRIVIFNRLRSESPEYRAFFLARLADVLNHELTPQFMGNLISHYETQARNLGVENGSFFSSLRLYVQRRPEVLRAQMADHFQAGPSYRLTVSGPAAVALAVDGRTVNSTYAGSYFADTPARIELVAPEDAAQAQWVVNGKAISRPTGPLSLSLTSDTHVDIRLAR